MWWCVVSLQFTSSNLSSYVQNYFGKKSNKPNAASGPTSLWNKFQSHLWSQTRVKLLTKLVMPFSPKPELARNFCLGFSLYCWCTQHTKTHSKWPADESKFGTTLYVDRFVTMMFFLLLFFFLMSPFSWSSSIKWHQSNIEAVASKKK